MDLFGLMIVKVGMEFSRAIKGKDTKVYWWKMFRENLGRKGKFKFTLRLRCNIKNETVLPWYSLVNIKIDFKNLFTFLPLSWFRKSLVIWYRVHQTGKSTQYKVSPYTHRHQSKRFGKMERKTNARVNNSTNGLVPFVAELQSKDMFHFYRVIFSEWMIHTR